MEKVKLKIAVLAMRKEDVKRLKELPGDVSLFIRNLKTRDNHDFDIEKLYSDHPDGWNPFQVQEKTIEDLIKEVGEKYNFDFDVISSHLVKPNFGELDGSSLSRGLANLKLKKETILFIIDCFSLEMEWIRYIAHEIDHFEIGCLMPMYKDSPPDLLNRMEALRDECLCYICDEFEESEVIDNAPTIGEFRKSLRQIAGNLTGMKIQAFAKILEAGGEGHISGWPKKEVPHM